MSCVGRDVIGEKGEKILVRNFKGHSGRINGQRAIQIIASTGTNRIGEPTAALLRTSAVRAAGEFDGNFHYAIDVEYWCRVLLHGDLWVIPAPLCAFRVSAGSWSIQAISSQSRDVCNLLAKLATTPSYQVGWLAWQSGRVRTTINMYLRRLFYLWILRRGNT